MKTADDLPLEIPPGGVNLVGFNLTLLRVLGRGGQGVVYLAHRPSLDRQEVAKFPDISPDAPHALADFDREIKALARLRCEHIVTIHINEVVHLNGRLRPYYTMEYVDGGTLRDRMRGEPMPPRQALTLAMEIAEGLSAAHSAGIVHRDIKPANVLLTRDGKPKLSDFGIARMINESRRATAGFIRGTARYMPPEAVRGEIVGPQGDLYSLGIMLFEMLTGRTPFDGNEHDLMFHQATTPAPTLRDVGRGGPFPPKLEELMRGLLAKSPHDRPQSAGELRRILESIRSGLPEDAGSDAFVGARDATLSVAASTRQGLVPIAIAMTRDGGAPMSPRMQRSDDPTVDAPQTPPQNNRSDAPTVDEPVGHAGLIGRADVTSAERIGRTGIVARRTEVEARSGFDGEETVPERPIPLVVARERKSRIPLIAAGIVLLLGGAALGAVFVMARTRDEPHRSTVPSGIASATTLPAPLITEPTTVATSVPFAPPPSVAASSASTFDSPAKPVVPGGVKPPGGLKSATATPPLSSASPPTVGPPTPSAATLPAQPAPTKGPIDDPF